MHFKTLMSMGICKWKLIPTQTVHCLTQSKEITEDYSNTIQIMSLLLIKKTKTHDISKAAPLRQSV